MCCWLGAWVLEEPLICQIGYTTVCIIVFLSLFFFKDCVQGTLHKGMIIIIPCKLCDIAVAMEYCQINESKK